MFRLNLTEVVQNLLIINILFFIGSYLLLGDGGAWYLLAMLFPGEEARAVVPLFGTMFDLKFYPYQIVTHMFMHGGLIHLLFNMLILIFIGPHLEYRWGPKRFLFFYFASGMGAAALYLFMTYVDVMYYGGQSHPVVGASGAMMGLMVGFGVTYPDVKLRLLFPPVTLKAKHLVLIYIAIDLFGGFSGYETGIAHFAHLGGALTGFLIMIYWNKFGSRL